MRRWMILGLLSAAACSDEGTVGAARGQLLAPELVDYGDLPLGFPDERIIPLTNGGSGPLTITAVELLSRADGHDIQILQDLVDTTIPAGGLSQQLRPRLQTLEVLAEPAESVLRLTYRAAAADAQMLDIRLRARGIDRGLFVRPNPVDFGRVLLGSARTERVELINLLTDPIDVRTAHVGARASLEEGGALFDVLGSVDSETGSLFPQRLAPGESKTVEIAYRPQPLSGGSLDQGLWRLEAFACSEVGCDTKVEEAELDLRGRGVRDGLVCEPSEADFGALPPGTSDTIFLRCRNASNAELDVLDWELASFSDDSFSVTEPIDFPRRLASSESFEIAVRFEAGNIEVGELKLGLLEIFAKRPEDRRPTLTVEIDLRGVNGGPQIVVTPPALDVGEVQIGETGRAFINIANAGIGDLELQPFEIVGPDAEAFRLAADQLTIISRGSSWSFPLAFEPTAGPDDPSGARPYVASLRIQSNDARNPVVEVPLRGAAVELGVCSYSVLPPALQFGSIPVQATSARTFVFANVGNEPCVVREFAIENDSLSAFDIEAGPSISVRVEPGDRLPVDVAFFPRNTVEYTADAAFLVSNRRSEQVRVPLNGFGGLFQLLAVPSQLDFGSVALGCAGRTQTISLTNVGLQPEAITSFEMVTAEPTGVFALRRLPSGLPPEPGEARPINPSQTLQFDVVFTPERVGRADAEINVTLRNRQGGLTIPIRGVGQEGSTRVDRFAQNSVSKVDLLWVLDNSFSMNDRLRWMRESALQTFNALDDANIDYQTAVVTTDMAGAVTDPCLPTDAQPPAAWQKGSCGFFSDGSDDRADPSWRVVNRLTQPSPAEAFAELLNVPTGGDAFRETGLEAMVRALTPPRVTGWNQGFLRFDADLAIIIVADEDDQGEQPVPFYASLVESLKAFGGRRSTINVIGLPDSCVPFSSEVGGQCRPTGSLRYNEAARLTGGITESIGVDPDADDEARSIEFGQKIFDAVFNVTTLRAIFPLSEIPAPGTLEVFVDFAPLAAQAPSGAVNWRYDRIANRINFTERGRPRPGAEIEIRYQTFCF